MLKKKLYMVMVSLMILMISSCDKKGSEPADLTEEEMKNIPANWRALHEDFFTLDSHVGISLDFTRKPNTDPGKKTPMQVDLSKMREGGLDGAIFTLYVRQNRRNSQGYEQAKKTTLYKMNNIHRMTDDLYNDQIDFAYTADEAIAIDATGKKVALIGIENAYVIGKDLSTVKEFYDLGARYMALVHIGHNDVCDSSVPRRYYGQESEEHGGVSKFGFKLIDEMNRLGMIVDISHASNDCMMQAVKYSKAPLIASHSAVKAIADHPRNLTDDQMKALADAGGVLQVFAFAGYIKVEDEKYKKKRALRLAITKAQGGEKWSSDKYNKLPDYIEGIAKINKEHPKATVKEYVDHIVYAVKVMGVDHVGIASDFGGGGGIEGWDAANETPNITKELFLRGFKSQEIEKIWSGNLLRVLKENEKVALSLQQK